MAMQVELVTPESVLFSGDATFVLARTVGGGDIMFLPGHVPFIGALADWPIEVGQADGPRLKVDAKGGFIEVSHDAVKILSDQAVLES
jgi:F-type H+-transporting ATPase subunit epsilon